MKKGKYKLEDIKIGNHVLFERNGINDFRMYWTVTGFDNNMIRVRVDEMGNKDELWIDAADVEILLNVNDRRYIQ